MDQDLHQDLRRSKSQPSRTLLDERAGASADASAVITDELPMIVWLRGDEPHCAEFILDAEDVMHELGIRRSRLTQISGRELRVGRMRRGRYVSPVYRQADVEAYARWTRATASHIKSSSLLTDAAETLVGQGEALAERLAAVTQELATATERSVRSGVLALEMVVRERSDASSAAIAALADEMRASESRLKAAFALQAASLEALTTQMNQQSLMLQVLTKDLAESNGALRLIREDVAVESAAMAVRCTTLEDAILSATQKPKPKRHRTVSSTKRQQMRAAATERAATKPARALPRRRPPR